MKNKLCALGLSLILLFSLAGCGSGGDAAPMTAKQFKRAMEEKGFEVVDQTDTAKDDSYQQIYVAADEEKYSFEYYFMKDAGAAKNVYSYAVSNLDATYGGDDTAKIKSDSDETTGTYEVSASDYYCAVCRNENTVLYVTAYHAFEDDAKSLIKDLR